MADQIGGASGNATGAQLLQGYTATSAAGPISGQIPIVSGFSLSPSVSAQTAISSGEYAGGAITVEPVGGTAGTGDVRSGQTFSSASGIAQTGALADNGSGPTVTPSTSNQTLAAGIYDTAITVVGDSALVPGNILSGVTLFNVAGTVAPNVTPSSGTITYSTPGEYTFSIPENVISLFVEMIGGGGGGGSAYDSYSGWGGGGGAYQALLLNVSGLSSASVLVGAGGAGGAAGLNGAGANGGNSSIGWGSYSAVAGGGSGGADSSTSSGGGPGGALQYLTSPGLGNATLIAYSGGGADSGDGGDASSAGGVGVTSPPGYFSTGLTGGAGGLENTSSPNGGTPGGGGAGAQGTGSAGNGGNGIVRMSW